MEIIIVFVVFQLIDTLIFQAIAKNNEFDPSFKRAFFVVFLSQITSTLLFLIPILVIQGLRISGVVFDISLMYVLVPVYIGLFILSLYVGIIFIEKFYEIGFRDSFSMLRMHFFYNLILIVPLAFIIGPILNLNF